MQETLVKCQSVSMLSVACSCASMFCRFIRLFSIYGSFLLPSTLLYSCLLFYLLISSFLLFSLLNFFLTLLYFSNLYLYSSMLFCSSLLRSPLFHYSYMHIMFYLTTRNAMHKKDSCKLSNIQQ